MEKKLPVFTTSRLILREIEDDDAEDMLEYASIPYVGPAAGWEPHQNINDSKAVIRVFKSKKKYGQLGVFAIVLKENKKMIGTIELHSYVANHKAELGYTISPHYWGQGLAAEASKCMIEWGFDLLGLKRIECTAFVSNIQSKRVCEKLQLEYEGIRKKGYQLFNGMIGDLLVYSIIDDDFYDRVRKDEWERL